ncbi:MAG: isoleucine--tRNA ligase [Dysgonamonadaceae bacterium]|nr:isoleucine--tRNA ligase [Dysgonamonadaceae bacterium]
MEYKDTLLMPKTDFQMRGNLPVNEELQRNRWEEMDLYNKILENNKDGKQFILHDGPPYANGNIHIGHALNKILKDMINRYKMLEGYKVVYIPGWDVHGLPIETAVTNTGINRKEMGKAEFRKLCENYANEQIENQKRQFKALNVIGDWDNPYITMAKDFEAKQIEVFAIMAKKGLISKGLKPVYWSPSSESALAEAEIEYKDRRDASLYVAFPVAVGNDVVEVGDNLVIWTTTGWTLPGNLGIAVGGEFNYAKVLVNGKNYIVANDLLEDLAKLFEWDNYEVISIFSGSKLENVKYKHVFIDRVSPVIVGDHVTIESGTGLVHTAPGYGAEDFMIGKEYDLGMINGVDDQGFLTADSGKFEGLFYEDANKAIAAELEENGSLLKLEMINHSYPHDWRTKKPVIFRATDQWFCSIDKIRGELLNEITNNIDWLPEWGEQRLYNMIKDRGDWCISRQRVWGVPIPIFYNEDGSEIIDYDVMMHISKLFKEHGSNIWFSKTAKELLPVGYTNPASPNGDFTKEEDIMDVWFDSGSTHTGVLLNRGLEYPADIYLEGSDQYRGWFNSSLICGVAVHGRSPYKKIVSHGFVLDGKGLKMSKSLGNVIDPLKLIKQNGTDILRLWVASVDYKEDVRISDDLINQVKESYRKIRNTYRFMLGNLFDFNPATDKVNYEDMPYYNQYMMVKLNEVIREIRVAYENHNFQEVYRVINNFITFTLSNFYLDFTKDILYIEGSDSLKRRSVQTVLYETLISLIKLLAPILPYTSEEVYSLLPGDKLDSIHLERNPKPINYENSETILKEWELFFDIKDDVFKALEEARNDKLIGKGLEARVYINAEGKYLEMINKLKDNLKLLLIVSEIVITEKDLPKYDNIGVLVEKFDGHKCERCWNYFKEEEMKEDICTRCHEVIE